MIEHYLKKPYVVYPIAVILAIAIGMLTDNAGIAFFAGCALGAIATILSFTPYEK